MEGAVALSGLVLVVGGLAVAAYSIVRVGTGEPLRMRLAFEQRKS